MAQSVKWRDARRYFRKHGYEIHSDGGDKVIVGPRTHPATRRSRAPVRIGHHFTKSNSELLDVHLRCIRTAFGVTAEDILCG